MLQQFFLFDNKIQPELARYSKEDPNAHIIVIAIIPHINLSQYNFDITCDPLDTRKTNVSDCFYFKANFNKWFKQISSLYQIKNRL